MFKSDELGWNTGENIVVELECSETSTGEKGLRGWAFPWQVIFENEHFDILLGKALQPIRYALGGRLDNRGFQ
jgi:hypothetical protein